MKTVCSASCGLWIVVIALASCGGSQPGSKVTGVVPSGIDRFTTASLQGNGKVVPVCRDKRPGRAECAALLLMDGR